MRLVARTFLVVVLVVCSSTCTSDTPAPSQRSQPSLDSDRSASSQPGHGPGSAPTITAAPATSLDDGQTIDVRVQGFDSFDRVHLSECANARVVTEIGCGAQLAQQPFIDTDEHGIGSRSFTVTATASTASLNSDTTSLCAAECVLVAVGTSGLNYTPLTFGP